MNMKKYTKIIALALALCLMACALCGCGKTETTKNVPAADIAASVADKIGKTEDTDHAKYKKQIQLIARTTGKDSDFIKECLELWVSALEAADTERHANNVERSTVHLYQTLLELGGRSRDIADIYKALCGKYGFPS